MGYLSYNEAADRSAFLAESSASSLGILMSTGDQFQLRNILRSFTTHETVAVWLKDESGKVILSTDRSNRSLPKSREFLHLEGGQVFIWTHHRITYNGLPYGDLVLLNLLQLKQWLYVSLFLLILNTLLFFWSTRALKKLSLNIGLSIGNIIHLFDNDSAEIKDSMNENAKDIPSFLEIEQLAENVKIMLHKIHMSVKYEKEAAIGRITAHLSHDLRSPLGTFERLLQSPDEALPSMRSAVRDSLNRLNSMIESLRHSEIENLVKKSASRINFPFGRESLQGKADDHKIELHIPSEDPGDVWIDPMKVERAWINLASNAIEAARSFVRVETEKVDTSLFIRVIDDGPGVPDDILPKLFQRGMTSGKAGGTGLGLAYVRQVMQGHGGDVTYRRENGLTIFECYLPHAVDHREVKSLGGEESKVIEKEVKTKQVSVCFTPASVSA